MKFSAFITRYAILFGTYIALSLTVGKDGVVSGFVSLSLVCLFISWLSGKLLLSDEPQLQSILVWAFVIKLGIGLAHTLLFFNPHYFEGTGDISRLLQHDFTCYYDYVSYLIGEKQAHYIFYFDKYAYPMTHKELLNIIATMMYGFGAHSMNLVPINSMLSSLGAVNIILVLKRFWPENIEKTPNVIKSVFLLMIFFPILLDNAIFIRDIPGQFLMSFAATLILLSKNTIQVVMLVPAAILMSYQRNVYMFAPVVLFAYIRLFYSDRKTKKSLIIWFVSIAAIMFAMSFVTNSLSDHMASREGSYGTSLSLATFPLRFLIGIIGPFPWTQIQYAFQTPSFASHIYAYFMGWLHVSCVFALLLYSGNRWTWVRHPLAILGLTLFSFGIINNCVHLSYITASTYFFVPLIYLYTRDNSFPQAMKTAFLFLIMLNILVVAIGGIGLKSVV